MNSIFRRLAALALCALLMLPAAGFGADEPPQGGVGMDISGFRSYTFAGEPVDGSIFAETELTVINIWQRWCGPCWIELPHFQQLHEYYSETPEADVQVWGALYYGDNPSTIEQAVDFVAENGYTWNHMVICDELTLVAADGDLTEYIIIPQTLIVDRYGVVRAQVKGKVDSYEELFDLTSEWLEILRSEYAAELGDIDLDGSVTSVDALLVLRRSMGIVELTQAELLRGDVNCDGEVDSVDALIILRMSLGIMNR